MPGAQSSRSGRGFASSRPGVGVGATFVKSGDLPPGCLFTGLGAERSEAGPGARGSRAALQSAREAWRCVRPAPRTTRWAPAPDASGSRLARGESARPGWPQRAGPGRRRSFGGSGAGPLRGHTERCVGRASSPAASPERGRCGPWVRQPPGTEGGVSSSGLIRCQPWERQVYPEGPAGAGVGEVLLRWSSPPPPGPPLPRLPRHRSQSILTPPSSVPAAWALASCVFLGRLQNSAATKEIPLDFAGRALTPGRAPATACPWIDRSSARRSPTLQVKRVSPRSSVTGAAPLLLSGISVKFLKLPGKPAPSWEADIPGGWEWGVGGVMSSKGSGCTVSL